MPPACSCEQQLADLADALRVKAIGRLVEDKQLGLAHQRRGEPKPLAHAERVRLHRAPIDPGQSDPAQRGVDPTPPGRPTGVSTARIEQGEIGPTGQVAIRGGAFDERANAGQDVPSSTRHRLAQQLDLTRGG